MKKIIFCSLLALAVISACQKKTTSTVPKFSSCYIEKYYYTYSGGNTDTTEVTYKDNDSLSYTTHASGTNYIYCYKIKGDSVSIRRYTNDLSVLSYYGTSFLNNQGFSIQDQSFKQNGTVNSTGSSTYNADGRPLHQISDYVDYINDFVNYYDANGNKSYSIYTLSGIDNYRDSFVYQYDLTHTSLLAFGYPNAGLFGNPDKNLVTQIRRFDSFVDTLKSTTNYTYTLDSDGFIIQRNNTTTYTGSGTVSNTVEKTVNKCL